MTSPDALLVLNAGTASVKFSLLDLAPDGTPANGITGQVEDIGAAPRFFAATANGTVLASSQLPRGQARDHTGTLDVIWGWLAAGGHTARLTAVGHRVIHGGNDYLHAVRIDDRVLERLARLTPLAPMQQPLALALVRQAMGLAPGVPHVACFDTAFHRTQPPVAQAYGLPRRLSHAGIRRYGFHGLSYEFIVEQLPLLDAGLASGRVVAAHLGAASSLCGLRDGRSVATTMGFSNLDGLVMATRSGTIDPSVLLYLMDEYHMDRQQLEDLLYHQSGLLGVSGLYGDIRRLLDSADARCQEAVDLYVYRINRELGSLVAALGGMDALVFTGGIGAGSAEVRSRILEAAAWTGVEWDPVANAAGGPRLSPPGARVSAWALPTDENLVIARQASALVALGTGMDRKAPTELRAETTSLAAVVGEPASDSRVDEASA